MAVGRLEAAGVETPLLDAQLIMARALGRPRLYVIAHSEYSLTESECAGFEAMVEQRAARWPLAYIIGSKEFFGLDLEVRPGVLVPRPETEVLVEQCLQRVRGETPVVADVGAGTGAIAVAVATNLPRARVYATEVSPLALEVARANITKHSLAERVTLAAGDLCGPLAVLGLEFDAILSNPPYIPTAEIDRLQPEVRDYEPRQALDGGPDGLDVYRRLLPDAITLLKPGAFTAVEVGACQAADVARIARSAGYCSVETVNDLAGIERVVVAYR